jgi:hypothetical protein
MRVQAQSKVLQTADMGIFLRVFPQLESITSSIVTQLEACIAKAKEGRGSSAEGVASIFLELRPLTAAYASYAGVSEEAATTLLSSTFSDYMASKAKDLMPLTLEQHLQAPFDAMHRYLVSLGDLTHPWHARLRVAPPHSLSASRTPHPRCNWRPCWS